MAKQLGTAATLEVDDTTPSGYTEVQNIKSIDQSVTVNDVDATDNDDNGVTTSLAGDEDGTFSFTFNYDDTNSGGQDEVMLAAYAKTTKLWRYRPVGNTSGASEYTFNGFVTEMTHAAAHEEIVEVSITLKITGGVTQADI